MKFKIQRILDAEHDAAIKAESFSENLKLFIEREKFLNEREELKNSKENYRLYHQEYCQALFDPRTMIIYDKKVN